MQNGKWENGFEPFSHLPAKTFVLAFSNKNFPKILRFFSIRQSRSDWILRPAKYIPRTASSDGNTQYLPNSSSDVRPRRAEAVPFYAISRRARRRRCLSGR